jgi:hypothetical protein
MRALQAAGKTSAAGLNRRRSETVSSRTSSSESMIGACLVMVFYLYGVNLAKNDDAKIRAPSNCFIEFFYAFMCAVAQNPKVRKRIVCLTPRSAP